MLRYVLTAGVLVGTATLAGCGGNAQPEAVRRRATLNAAAQTKTTTPKATTKPAPSQQKQDAIKKFTACMREHGVTVPTGRQHVRPDSADMNKLRAAHEACAKYLDGLRKQFAPPAPTTEQRQKMKAAFEKFAECLGTTKAFDECTSQLHAALPEGLMHGGFGGHGFRGFRGPHGMGRGGPDHTPGAAPGGYPQSTPSAPSA